MTEEESLPNQAPQPLLSLRIAGGPHETRERLDIHFDGLAEAYRSGEVTQWALDRVTLDRLSAMALSLYETDESQRITATCDDCGSPLYEVRLNGGLLFSATGEMTKEAEELLDALESILYASA